MKDCDGSLLRLQHHNTHDSSHSSSSTAMAPGNVTRAIFLPQFFFSLESVLEGNAYTVNQAKQNKKNPAGRFPVV